MYLLIFDEGAMGRKDTITQKDLDSAIGDLMDIINISENPPLLYTLKGWIEIEPI